jgi:hypothetical protein
MVKCSQCGAENQPESVYCPNCGIPVRQTEVPRRQSLRTMSIRMLIGLLIGAALFGGGIVLGLLGAQSSSSTLMWTGGILIMIGIITIIFSVVALSDR